MKKLIYIAVILCIINGSFLLYSQSISYTKTTYADLIKMPKMGFATKVFGGGFFFPGHFPPLPLPAGGASASLFIGRFEIEAGAYYFKYLDRVLAPDPSYQYVDHEGDYINGFLLGNVKIAQVKKNVFSGYIGIGFRKNVNWNNDTAYNDGSHNRTEHIQTTAQRTVGISLMEGVRYMYFFKPKICLVVGLDLLENLHDEFRMASGDHIGSSITSFPPPPEPDFQIGISVGIQFVLAGKAGTFYKY